jgi:hypothetical protein
MRLTVLDLLVGAAALALLWLALAPSRSSRADVSVLANPALTPGATNTNVTQATIRSTICVHGWTATVRPPTSYTSSLKRRQLRDFGLPGPSSGYQEDHLISLELGGDPTDPRNLWPEPYPRAGDVDRIENELNAKVCSGGLALAAAQREEAALKHEHG